VDRRRTGGPSRPSQGTSKPFVHKDKLAENTRGEWTKQASAGFGKTLGVLELLAAVGLILPSVLNIARSWCR